MSFTRVDFYHLSCKRICDEKKSLGWEIRNASTTAVFFGRKKAEECDVWCHERFQPRSGVRYFNWNIVPRSACWKKLFHQGWLLDPLGPLEVRPGKVLQNVGWKFYKRKNVKRYFALNKLAKARKTRTSPSTLGLKKFGLGKLWVKKVFRVKKFFGSKKVFWVKKVFGSKKLLGQKSF